MRLFQSDKFVRKWNEIAAFLAMTGRLKMGVDRKINSLKDKRIEGQNKIVPIKILTEILIRYGEQDDKIGLV